MSLSISSLSLLFLHSKLMLVRNIHLFYLINFLFISIDRGDFMTSERDGYNRFDPDSTLNGFFPFWGVVLLILSCKSFSFSYYNLIFN